MTLAHGREGSREDIPVRIKLSARSVLGTQGKQGTQLAAALLERVHNTQVNGAHN